MYCKHCGGELNGEDVCLKCGKMTSENDKKVPVEEDKVMVLSIVGFVLAFIYPIASFIISIIALKRYKNEPIKKYRPFAVAGVSISSVYIGSAILSYIGSIVSFIICLVVYILIYGVSSVAMMAPLF